MATTETRARRIPSLQQIQFDNCRKAFVTASERWESAPCGSNEHRVAGRAMDRAYESMRTWDQALCRIAEGKAGR